jgi:hypothetical protein
LILRAFAHNNKKSPDAILGFFITQPQPQHSHAEQKRIVSATARLVDTPFSQPTAWLVGDPSALLSTFVTTGMAAARNCGV